ncbi:MAG TPA: alpha/beta fold hydrolase [Steroidobacteraceae bacterium]|nr:alpha/beta fold hydrolase [Steroidobacteraceae bacterium]
MSALNAEVRGRGRRDLVLLHGWGMNLKVWDGLAEALARRFRVIAIDLPGHGRSDWDGEAYSPAAQTFRVHETLAPLTTRYHLLGWSLGGQFALDLAAAMPAGIERLILVATTPRFLAGPGWRFGVKEAALERLAVQVREDPQEAVRGFLRQQVRGLARRTAGQVSSRLSAALEQGGAAHPDALRWGLERLRQGDLRMQLSQVRAPTLVIAGQDDRITPPGASRALAAALPKGSFRQLRGAGHVPFLSNRDQFLAALDGFLRG